MKTRTLLWVGVLLVAMSSLHCVNTLNVSAMRTGKIYAALPATCPVTFKNLSFQEARGKYEQIGLVSLTGAKESQPQTWTGKTKEMLQPKVCQMGGHIVTFNASGGSGTVMGMGTNIIQYIVWRKK